MASAPRKPAEVITKRASANSCGAFPVSPAKANTLSFIESTSSVAIPTRPTIFAIEVSKSIAVFAAAPPNRLSGNVKLMERERPTRSAFLPKSAIFAVAVFNFFSKSEAFTPSVKYKLPTLPCAIDPILSY